MVLCSGEDIDVDGLLPLAGSVSSEDLPERWIGSHLSLAPVSQLLDLLCDGEAGEVVVEVCSYAILERFWDLGYDYHIHLDTHV